ncbi:hypothetical protein ACSBR2_014572 [Camellia fascicularis]
MSHAMVVSLCFPTVRSAANRSKQRVNKTKALTRNETGAVAEQVDLEFPKVEVQFQDLCVDAFVHVGSKALPTISNFIFNMTETFLGQLRIFPGRRKNFCPDVVLGRDKIELELDFKRHWEEFRSSSSEKAKETALNMTVDVFCRLVKQHTNVAQLLTMLVETHIFSFVVGRAFVTDIEKLKISSKSRSLDIGRVLSFFLEVTKMQPLLRT